MQADNEYRFGQLEQGKGGGKRAVAAAPSAPQTAPAPADTAVAARSRCRPPTAGSNSVRRPRTSAR